MNPSRRSIIAVFFLGVAVSACNTSSPAAGLPTVSQDTASGFEHTLSAQALISGVTYWISNMCNAKRLEVQRNTPAGAVPNVQIRSGDDSLGQRWKLVYDGPGHVRIEAQSNRQLLSIRGGIKTDGGSAVTLPKQIPTLLEQQWKVETAANGFSILTARHSGKVLQVRAGSSLDGAQVEQGTDARRCSQRWKFTAVPVTPPTSTALRLLYSPETGGLVKFNSRAETFARNSSIINQLPGNAIYLTIPGT